MMVDYKFDDLYRSVFIDREPPEVGLVEKLTGKLYIDIESATTLSDYIAGARNLSVDFQYDVQCRLQLLKF